MKTLTPGHRYELDNFEHPLRAGQIIQFIEKVPAPRNPDEPETGTLVTVNDGTTNEEVLSMLLDRLSSLQAKFPCRENAVAITHIESGLLWLNHRTANRKTRGVEGKQLK